MTHDMPSEGPKLERVRHELVRRTLTVKSAERLTPRMHRIILTGDALHGFTSLGFDDHLKIMVDIGQDEPARRDYTPRHFDPVHNELTVDFAAHDAGPATLWALSARPGDTVGIGGPRGSQVISGEIHQWLLIGDETALPAIGRKIEESGATDRMISLVSVTSAADEQSFVTAAAHQSLWVHRPPEKADDASYLLAALRDIPLPPRTFVWIAAEGSVTRALRQYLVQDRGHPLTWLKASGYWVKGQADTTEKFEA